MNMIEIKISGASIPELADKLLAIGNSLRVQSSYEADNAAREGLQAARDAAVEAEKPKATRSRKKAEEPAAAESAPVTVIEDAPEETVDTETGEVTETVPSIDEVTQAVLAAVERVGRDKVVAILTQFGVARASQVAEAQRAELLAMVQEA
jgi:hypothetical protein